MIYLEEEIAKHRKMIIAGSMIRPGGVFAALGLYVAGLGYAREHLTNGRVDDEFLGSFPPISRAFVVAKVLSSRRVQLWHRVKGGYRIHDFHDHNEAADKVKYKRELARKRKAAERARKAAAHAPMVTHHVTDRVTANVTRDPARARPTPTVRTYDPVQRGTGTNENKNARPPASASTTGPALLAWRRRKSKGTDTAGRPNVPVLAALARDILTQHADEHEAGELEELIKIAAARANLKYDSRSIREAHARAQHVLTWQRRKARAS